MKPIDRGLEFVRQVNRRAGMAELEVGNALVFIGQGGQVKSELKSTHVLNKTSFNWNASS
jgi:hypothetical protein